MYQHMQLKIGDLLVNNDNPRYESVESQREAIEVMIREQDIKLVELGKHIVEHGLSPIDTVLVRPSGKLWVVQEGNRRITALKLLANPSLVPEDLKNIHRAFRGLAADVDTHLLENIPCVYCDDEKEANEWIRLKHTGENAGAGTVRWDGQQSGRFSLLTSEKPDPKMTFLEELKSHPEVPNELRNQIPKILKTNFERLISDPNIRYFCGISYKNEKYEIQQPVSDRFLLMISDLIGDKLFVSRIYHKEDRAAYIEDVSKRLENPRVIDSSSAKHETKDEGNYNSCDQAKTASVSEQSNMIVPRIKNMKKSYPVDRNTIIPSSYSLPIDAGRISIIFRELKKLPLDQFPNAAAVLFRVFVELTVDNFIERKGLKRINNSQELNKKIIAVADFFEDNEVMTSKELRAARAMSSGQFQTQSVQTFHSYVHNARTTPVARDLCSAWHDISQFIEKIWEET